MRGAKRPNDNYLRSTRRHRQWTRQTPSTGAIGPERPEAFYGRRIREIADKLGYGHEYTPMTSVLKNPNDPRNQPLYPGCSLTVLQAVTMELDEFATCRGVTKAVTSQRLSRTHTYLLPPGNKMPKSMDEAERLIKDLLLKKEEYHVCPNDCIAYRKEHEHLSSCPVCGTPRYKTGGTVPRKKFFYLPITQRIRRMFENPGLAQALQSHWPRPSQQDGVIRDLHDSPAWAEVYGPGGKFHGENYCLQLEFSADGLNPYDLTRVKRSIWPGSVKVLNLPSAMRNKVEHLNMVMMITGPREPKNVNPYLGPFVDELKMLEGGVKIYDASRSAVVNVRAEVMLYVMDYPGQCKFGKTKGAGANSACNKCWITGTYCKPLHKMIYVGHRSQLAPDHYLRQATGFPEATPETRGPWLPKTKEEMLRYGKIFEDAPTPSMKNLISKATGKTGIEEFYRLESYGPEKYAPEMMHCGTDVGQKLVKMVSGFDDTKKVRLAEQQRFPETLPTTQAQPNKGRKKVLYGLARRVAGPPKRSSLPTAPWSLKKSEKIIADNRLASIRVPMGFGWIPEQMFVKFNFLKSHQWKEFTAQGILIYTIRGLLGDKQRAALIKVCIVLGALTYPVVNRDKIAELRTAVVECVVLLERDYPCHVMVSVVHMLIHVPDYLEKYGPSREFWMFIFERFMHIIAGKVTSNRYPEASAVESYLYSEFCETMKLLHPAVAANGSQSSLTSHHPDSFQLTNKKRKSVQYTLSSEQLEQLTKYYMATNPRLRSMIRSLQRERTESGSRQPLKAWTPSRTLTEAEREVIAGPSSDAEKFFVAQKSVYGKLTEYRCEEVEERSRERSSFVGKNIDGIGPCFARIQYFVRHRFMGEETDLAYVRWLPRAERDEETNLFVIDTDLPSPPHQPFLATGDFSNPLVTATDPDDGQLWVLNYDNVLVGV